MKKTFYIPKYDTPEALIERLDKWNESRRASFVEAFGYCYEDARELISEMIFEDLYL